MASVILRSHLPWLSAPGTRLGAYEIVVRDRCRRNGRSVSRDRNTNLAVPVAIKVLSDALASDDERLARFQREAKFLASLNHPNIAAIYGLERSAVDALS